MILNGATRLVPIIGDPVAQVKSPAGMTAGLQARGHNTIVVPIHVAPEALPILLAALDATRNCDGLIATIPHKFACYRHCATASPRAHVLQAVNILRRNTDGTWHGDMFDGEGFVAAAVAKGCRPAGRRALLVGAGGAGSAIGLALLEAGVAELGVHDLDPARRDALRARLAPHHPGKLVAGSSDPGGFDIVANASPAGMRPGDALPIDVARLSAETFVGCAITSPACSPVVEAARAIGCPSLVGGEMYLAVQGLLLEFLRKGRRESASF